ncbi:fumarylacetoacetate hydrolase family protein [Herbidospora sp. RD11066]
MYLARRKVAAPDGPDHRIIVSSDPGSGLWSDVRTVARLRLERGGATATAAAQLAAAAVPASMTAALELGDAFWDSARHALESTSGDGLVADPVLGCPVDPAYFRDFMVFEEHFSSGYKWQGKEVPRVLYDFPISYMGNASAVFGPGDTIPCPGYTDELDIELELGIVLARTARDVRPDTALDCVAGVTILNDFSARDIQREEMAALLGPSKGKHFATAIGPWIATLDEIPESGLRMRAVVDGEEWTDANSGEMIWDLAEIVAWASSGEVVPPGAVLGTGTCNGGSGLEIGKRLKPGSRVRLDVDRLGRLENRIGLPAEVWRPASKYRS